MALFFADLVREACWATGTGDLALDGALPGHRTFAAAVPGGARFHYAIAGITHVEQWETGEGEIAGGLLMREPIASSGGGAAVDFAAGLKTVALTVGADWFAARDGGIAAIDDVAGLEAALAGKAPIAHAHAFAALTGRPTTLAGYGITDAAPAAHNHDGAYQPLDSDLTAIAGLSTTAFGRDQLALADAAALRGHAGLGSLAVQPASNVAITGGTISGISDLAVADGGTGASSAAAARNNLGPGTVATQNANNVTITGGGVTGLDGLQISGATASGNGSGIELFGGGLGLIQGYNRTTGNYITLAYDGALHLWRVNGANAMVVSAGGLNIAAGALAVGDVQVVAARRPGWSAPSGTASRTSFDTAGVSTEALAQRVKALIDDLSAHGLIGS